MEEVLKMRPAKGRIDYWIENGCPASVRHLFGGYKPPKFKCDACRVMDHNERDGTGWIKLCGRPQCTLTKHQPVSKPWYTALFEKIGIKKKEPRIPVVDGV